MIGKQLLKFLNKKKDYDMNILIVEDEAISAKRLERLLKKKNLKILRLISI